MKKLRNIIITVVILIVGGLLFYLSRLHTNNQNRIQQDKLDIEQLKEQEEAYKKKKAVENDKKKAATKKSLDSLAELF